MQRNRLDVYALLAAFAIFLTAASWSVFHANAVLAQASPAQQAPSAAPATQRPPAVSYEAPIELQHTDLPQWPYTPPPPPGTPRVPDDGSVHHIPGSDKAYTMAQVNDGYGPPDWFPDSHPPAPSEVTQGRRDGFRACGECHLINGRGKPDSASLNGLPVAYMLQQMEDMKNDLRHASVTRMGILTMIPVSKGITVPEAKEAAAYFHSIKPTKWVRVVESDNAPKTHSNSHRLLIPEADGSKEPIGNRIVEVPESAELTDLRDPLSPFIAYVPVGSIKKGEALVKTGGNGRTTACTVCHGQDLRGMGDTFPPLAGRSPGAMGRQLYDFKTGARNGKNAALMKGAVANLTDEDIVNIMAYVASLDQ